MLRALSMARLLHAFGVEINVRELIDWPAVAALVAHIENTGDPADMCARYESHSQARS